jgi:hypothetical protein
VHVQDVRSPDPAAQHALRDAILGQTEAMERCYADGVRHTGTVEGKIELEGRITPAGRVVRMRVSSDSTGSPGIGACLVQVLRQLHFGRPPWRHDTEWGMTFQLYGTPVHFRDGP